MIAEEIAKVQATDLDCNKYGFFSRSGFTTQVDERTILIDLKEMYEGI